MSEKRIRYRIRDVKNDSEILLKNEPGVKDGILKIGAGVNDWAQLKGCNGATPVFMIEGGHLLISYNDGQPGSWYDLGQVQGEQGIQGEKGEQGEQGVQGEKGETPTILQTTGDSETEVMSQKAVTEELGKKLDTSGGTMTAPLKFTSDQSIVNNSTASIIHLLTAKGYNIATYTPNNKTIMFGVSTHKLSLRASSINVNGEDISEYLRIPRLYKHLLPLGERDWFEYGEISNAWLEIIDDSSAEYTAWSMVNSFAIVQNSGNLISAKIRFFSTNNADTFYSVLLGSIGEQIDKAFWLNPYTNTFVNALDNPMPSDFEDTVTELYYEEE